MLNPKKTQNPTYWDTLSDEELLSKELTTEDPSSLPNLTTKLPDGIEDSYVEYTYDFRNSEREELTCVHGHHKHLAGCVMRKGDIRWLVGWMCAESIYGEKFCEYKADYNAAVTRRQGLARRHELESWMEPFMEWLERTNQSDVFRFYEDVRAQLRQKMAWIWNNGEKVFHDAYATSRFQAFFDERTDPKREFAEVISQAMAVFAPGIGQRTLELEHLVKVREILRRLIAHIERIIDKLAELVDLFQPVELDILCRDANKLDNPNKRKYSNDVNSITCSRDREKSRVQIPAKFSLPNRSKLQELKVRLETI
jgi:hypothetical protein